MASSEFWFWGSGKRYGDQTFLWSTDGLTWEEAVFTGGHPIFFLTFGWAEPSDVCP